MAAETTKIVDVLDPQGRKKVPRAASLYLLASNEPLLLCHIGDPGGDVVTESQARKRHADAIRSDGNAPYQCSPEVCGYCLSKEKENE